MIMQSAHSVNTTHNRGVSFQQMLPELPDNAPVRTKLNKKYNRFNQACKYLGWQDSSVVECLPRD